MKATSKMKMSPGIQLDVVVDQLGFPDDSPKTWMNPPRVYKSSITQLEGSVLFVLLLCSFLLMLSKKMGCSYL
jgi:hypothetical protein